MTFNIMIPCQENPTMLAHTEIEGQFDLKNTPLEPPRIKVIINEKQQHSKTWGMHGVPGWYIGPTMEPYQCYTCYTPTNRGEWNADAAKYFPQHLVMPGLSKTEQSTKSSKELIQVLKSSGPQTPFIIINYQLHAIDRMAILFNSIKLEKTQTKVLPREVPTIAPLRLTIPVSPPGVLVTVAPPRVMTPRVPMIS